MKDPQKFERQIKSNTDHHPTVFERGTRKEQGRSEMSNVWKKKGKNNNDTKRQAGNRKHVRPDWKQHNITQTYLRCIVVFESHHANVIAAVA